MPGFDSSYLSGGGVGAVGSGLASGPSTGNALHNLDEFVTGPGLTPPAGANLTGTSSLQRAFPERFGGDLMQYGSSPSVVAQLSNLPANIAETPLSFLDTATGGGIGGFLKTIGDHTPIGGAVDFLGGAIQKAFSLPAAMMNSSPAQVIGQTWNLPDSTVITPELLMQHGLNPTMANQFKKNGLPILGWLGLTGDQMTVGDLKSELDKRGFTKDANGQALDWSDVAAKANDGPLGSFQFGDKSVNENGLSDFALQGAGQTAEIAVATALTGGADIPGLVAGGLSKLGIGVRGADELATAAKVADDINGVGQAAKTLNKAVKPLADWAKPAAVKISGSIGDGAVNDLAENGIKAITTETVSPTVAAEQIAAGNVASTSLKGAAQYWMKKALLPGGDLPLLTRYYLGQTRLRAALFGTEQLTGALQSHGINIGPIADLHDFTQAVLDDHPLSDNAVFQAATAFTFPFKEAVKDVTGPITAPIRATQAVNQAGRIFETEAGANKIGFGAGAIEKMGGPEAFASHMDRMAQSIAQDRVLAMLSKTGLKAKYESIVEAATRLHILGKMTQATSNYMLRTGKITARDLVQRFRDVHEQPILTTIAEDGTRVRRPLPFRTVLSPDTIITHAKNYAEAEKAFSNPFFGQQTAVLGRASRMTQEDLDAAAAHAQAAAGDTGLLDAQFVRDLLYNTPGMLDDITIPAKAHDWLIDKMNPAKNEALTSDEVVGILKNLKDVAPTRDELWHELAARDANTPVDPGQNGVPGGPTQNGVLRNIHSTATLKRWRVEADSRVRQLTKEREAQAADYNAQFSKRGKAKPSAADHNWETNAQTAMDHTTANGGGTFSPRTGKPRNYTSGYSSGGHSGTFGTVAEGDAEGLRAAAKAVRTEYPGADVGTWRNPATGMIEVDPSFHFTDKGEALRFATEHNQQAIYDHGNKTDIEVGGPLRLSSKGPFAKDKIRVDQANAPTGRRLSGLTGKPNSVTYDDTPTNPQATWYGPDGKAHGYAAVLHKNFADEANPGPPMAVSVYVDPKFRRQGVATKLYQELEAHGVDVKNVSGLSTTAEGEAFSNSYLGKALPSGPGEPTHFSAETEAANETRRQMMMGNLQKVNSELKSLKSGLKEYRARAQALRVTEPDFSFYTPDGSPKVSVFDAQRLADLQGWVRENFPQYEVEAGPRLMNKYSPNDHFIKNLMIEHSAIQQVLFDWGPVSKMGNAIEAAFRPVKGGRESRDMLSRLNEVLMAHGATKPEIDNFLKYTNEVLAEGRQFGIGGERIPLTRGIQGMSADQIARQAYKAFKGNDAFNVNFAKRYGGVGTQRMYVALAEAYNPVVRNIQRTIEQGGQTGRMARLFASGYDRYHVGFTQPVAAFTRMTAKFLYPFLRFTANPLYHVYNLSEADIIGATQDGLKVWKNPVNAALSSDIYEAVKSGNPEARASAIEAERRLKTLGINPDTIDLQGATLDQTGVTFGMNARRARIAENQIVNRTGEEIMGVLKSFPADDPAMQAAMKRYGGTPDTWVEQLSKDIYSYDKEGVAASMKNAIKGEGWSPAEMKAMEPITTAIVNKMQSTFDDIYHIHVGNVNRTRLERVLNSYWLFWPASYMLKANKWMFGVLTGRALGAKTNVGGAWTLNQLSNIYHQRYQNDPEFRKTVDDNKDLEFMLSAILPVAPWSDGVSLNRMTRYIGGNNPVWSMWPEYSNFDLTNMKDWTGKMSDIGPIYSLGLAQDVMGDLGKDFPVSFPSSSSKQIAPSAVDWAQSLLSPTPSTPAKTLNS